MTESSPFPWRSLSRLGAALLLVLFGAAAVPSLQAAETCNRAGCGRLSGACGGFPAKPAPADRWT